MPVMKGTNAKAKVIKKIQEAFGEDYVGEFDKKVYVLAEDKPGEEKIQIAITLTTPKIQRGVNEEEAEKAPLASPAQPVVREVTPKEQETLAFLMNKLGL